MKGYSSLTSFACALVIGAALHAGVALGGHPETPAFQAGAGVLSYSFFNLSGQSCNFQPVGAGQNSNAQWPGSGWNNSGNNLGFFNNGNPDGSGSYVFYNNPDPINTSSSGTPPPFPNTILLGNGTGSGSDNTYTTVISTETWQNWSINYPAIGDSWEVNCGSYPGSLIATLASSGNSLQSGWYGSQVGSIPNANIAPTGPSSNPGQDCISTQQPNTATSVDIFNPCGATFTYQPMNWNLASSNSLFQDMGGFWSGINYTGVAPIPAVSSLNFSTLPINFSAYVQSSSGINFTDMTPNVQTYYTPIYGGHTAITVGDPYLVSSISAKILWFLATNSSFTLNNGTSVSTIAETLSNSGGTGVFWSNSYEDAYVQWFVGSQSSSSNYPGQPSAAANAYNYAVGQASVPINQETIWGKVFSGLADVAINLVNTGLSAIPGAGGVIAGAIGAAAGGAVTADVNSAIANATQYSVSGAPPDPTQAPVTFNDTFAATNLFGMLLTNMGVQSEINAINKVTDVPSPLWSNYDINTDYDPKNHTGCSTSSIEVTNNLMQGSCYDLEGNLVANDSNSTGQQYTNVYVPSTSKQSTTQLSIWNAILSGTNITANASGYMVTGGANQYPSFSPPTVVVNASSSSFTANSIVVNTAFNPNTGYLSANSIGVAQAPPNNPVGSSSPPSNMPGIIPPQNITEYPIMLGYNPITYTVSVPVTTAAGNPNTQYDKSTGILTINELWLNPADNYVNSNEPWSEIVTGPESINMTQCPEGSLVYVSDAVASYTEVSYTLQCQPPPTALTNIALDYGSCTQDQYASGGVYAAVTTPPNDLGTVGDVVLACACVPSYLDGPSTSDATSDNLLGGYVVGATSAKPNQTCPKPST